MSAGTCKQTKDMEELFTSLIEIESHYQVRPVFDTILSSSYALMFTSLDKSETTKSNKSVFFP